MKSGTPSHRKVRRLARRLNITRAHAIGLLCCLWDSAERACPNGDIGRLEDEDIAEEIFWEGDPSELVSALIEEHWLDASDEHRLIIHDWPDHCADYIHRRLCRSGALFANGQAPRYTALNQHEREAFKKYYPEVSVDKPVTNVQTVKQQRSNTKASVKQQRSNTKASVKARCTRGEVVAHALSQAHAHINSPIPPNPPCAQPKPDQTRPEELADLNQPQGVGVGTPPVPPQQQLDREAVLAGLSPEDRAAVETIRQRREAVKPKAEKPPMAELVNQATTRLVAPPDMTQIIEAAASLCTDLERAAWAPWLAEVIPKIVMVGGSVDLEDAVRYVEACGDPAQRVAKSLGPLKQPGRYLVKQLISILKSRGLQWPKFPEVVT